MNIKAYTSEQIQQHAYGAQAGGPEGISGAIPSTSSAFETLNHNAYDISYPNDWHVYGDQNSAVTIAPEGGVSQNAVAYGAIINGTDIAECWKPERCRAAIDLIAAAVEPWTEGNQ